MKRIVSFLVSTSVALSAIAQDQQPAGYLRDNELSRWSVEVNGMGGITTQDLSWGSSSFFKNKVNDTVSGLKYNNGTSFGFEAQLGYFFGKNRNFGIGIGLISHSQSGNVTLDKYHMEYQSTDSMGVAFRQVSYANGQLKENVSTTNMNIPIVMKYRKRLSKLLSFNADAGLLLNFQMQNQATMANANFNYEALYGFDDAGHYLTNYDASYASSSAQVQVTESYYFHTHPNTADHTYTFQDAQNYFSSVRAGNGQNVALGVTPAASKTTVNYTSGTIGVILHPELGFHLTDNWLVDVGAFYMFQPFKNNYNSNYHLTDKIGEYNGVLAGTSSNTTQTFGGSLGIRWYITKGKHVHKDKDSDHDGVPNKIDRCPHDSGSVALQGCPDRDGDGIADIDDSCKDVAGLAKFNGCPDTDGDGIPDKLDACPDKAGLAQFNGCPDTDGDGIPDKDDLCPFQPGPAKFNGCPDTDGDGIPDNLDKCPNVWGPVENQGCPVDTARVEVKKQEEPAPKSPVDVTPVKDREVTVAETNKKPKKEPKKAPKKEPDVEPTSAISISAPVLFDLNKSTIRESSKPMLTEAVKKINDNKDAFIVVEGYTDTTGPVSYNKVLSKMRANVLKKYLVEQGVSEDRIRSVGMGSKAPVGDNNTHEGRMKNRRAEMKWAGKKD
jgi:outer membrane protein OmpA-like peptidoglycan-associated protein